MHPSLGCLPVTTIKSSVCLSVSPPPIAASRVGQVLSPPQQSEQDCRSITKRLVARRGLQAHCAVSKNYNYNQLCGVPNGPRAPLEGASRDPTRFARKGPSLPYSLRSGGGTQTDTRTLDFIYIQIIIIILPLSKNKCRISPESLLLRWSVLSPGQTGVSSSMEISMQWKYST